MSNTCSNPGCLDIIYPGHGEDRPFCYDCEHHRIVHGDLPRETPAHSLRRRLANKGRDVLCKLSAWRDKPGWWWYWSTWAPCAGCGEMVHPWLDKCQFGSDAGGMGGLIPYCDQCNLNLGIDTSDPLPGYDSDGPYIPWRGAAAVTGVPDHLVAHVAEPVAVGIPAGGGRA
ncbi:MAG: hypothetical protein MPK62_00920 [Alphaproteobacteria bacterium]|nr:hypothetical protein [Alphaproteobacteria bacterium]MDA8029696.1 hypothetical protein [Alphaproteobacteria bacterium]